MEAVVYEAANGHPEKSRLQSESASWEQNGGGRDQEDEDLVLENGLSRLPSTQPVDIQFENVAFTASLGFRKGLLKVQ